MLAAKPLAIATGVLAAIVLVLGFLLKGAYEDLGEARAAVKAAVAANDTNQDTIDELETENARWAELHAADQEKAARLVSEAVRERDAARARLSRERAEWRTLYEQDPDADAWARTRVPDAIVDRLRRLERGDRDPDRGEEGAGVHPDPGGADRDDAGADPPPG